MPVKKAFGAHRSDEYNGTHTVVYELKGAPCVRN